VHPISSPQPGSNRLRPTHGLAALVTVAGLVIVGCSSSDDSSAPAVDTVGSTVAVATPVPATAPATSSPDSASPPLSAAFTDSLIVFQSEGNVQTVLPDGSNSTVVTSGAPGSQEHPDWSRDGLRIVFDTEFSHLWTVNADGSELETVYECVSPCQSLQDGSWSPDGEEIAFMVAESVDGTTTSRSAILAVNVSTGDVRTIYEDTSGKAWLFHPRWSGDGSSIVFEEDTYVSTALTEEEVTSIAVAVVAADGGATPEYLTTLSGPFDGPGSPAPDWSPVDDLIVFTRADNLFTIGADGSGEAQVTDFDAVEEHAIQPTFTPDGSAIVFTYVTGEFGVNDSPTAAVIGLDGSGLSTVGGGARMTHPRFQP
jgi:Tol biopolymer transport system component